MSTAELKINLINEITSITDKVKLEDIMQLLKFQTDESIFVTTEEDKTAIKVARRQIQDGKCLTNEALQTEMNAWLKK